MKRETDPRHMLAAGFVLAVIGIAALLVGIPRPVIAQFSAQGTWIPSSGVGGTGSAVTLTVPNIASMSDLLGVPLRFIPANTNAAGGTTITVNAFSAESVKRSSSGLLVPIAGGDFTAGGTAPFAEVIWDGTEFVQKNPATGNDAVGTEKSFTNTVPAGWLVEDGSCYSRTTYAALFAYYGSTDLWATQASSSCTGSQFAVPKANGRISVAVQNQGSGTGPLTNCTAGVTVNCGAQQQTLVAGQVPQVSTSYTPAGSVTTSLTNTGATNGGTSGAVLQNGATAATQGNATISFSASSSFSGTPATITVGSGSPSPVSIINYNYQVYKAVKY